MLAHRAVARTGSMLFVHNLSERAQTVDLSVLYPQADQLEEVFADRGYPPLEKLQSIELAGYGYRWIRLRRNPVG